MSGRKKDLSVFYLTVAGSEKEETFFKRPNEIETRSGGCSFLYFYGHKTLVVSPKMNILCHFHRENLSRHLFSSESSKILDNISNQSQQFASLKLVCMHCFYR